jgi:hypothetical protein
MNIKRLILAILAGWVVIFGTDILVHHFALMPDYKATKAIWRPEPDMNSRLHWMLIAQFLGVATFVIVWAKGFAGGSAGNGAVFGLLMGLFQAIWVLMTYVLFPIPGDLAVKWFGCGIIQTVLLGVVTALVYKRNASAAGE